MINEISARTVVRTMFKRRTLFTSIAGSIILLGIVYLLLATPLFESEASILSKVAQGDQDLAAPTVDGTPRSGGAAASANVADEIVGSQRVLLGSRDLIGAAIDSVGLEKIYPKMTLDKFPDENTRHEIAITTMVKRDLDVDVQKNSTVMLLKLRNPDPVIAQQTLRAVISSFLDKQALATRDPQMQFLQGQMESLQTRVNEAQAALMEFKRKTGISDYQQESQLLLKQRDALQESLTLAQSDLASAQQRQSALNQSLGATASSISISDENDRTTHQVDEARARLDAAQIRYQQATLNFAAGNPELLDAKAALDLAQSSYDAALKNPSDRVRTGSNPVHQQLSGNLALASADAAGARASIAARQKQLDDINARIDFLNAHQTDITDLQHRQDVAVDDLKSYVDRTATARIMSDLNQARITNTSVIQVPSLPYKAAYPRKALTLALAILAGVFAAVGVCLALEMQDQTATAPDDLGAATGLPILVSLEKVGAAGAAGKGSWGLGFWQRKTS